MILSLIIMQHNGNSYDIADFVSSGISFEDNVNKAGVISFIIKKGAISIEEGSRVFLTYDDAPYFSGFIFKISTKNDGNLDITAYDQLRYLKTQDTYVFGGITAKHAIAMICNDFKLITGELQETGYKLPSLIFDNKNILDMISDLLTCTMTKTNNIFVLKDNAGLIELKNIRNNISDICIDPECNIFEYEYSRSIDDNTYNQIKLVQDNKTTGTRDLYIARDSSTIAKWGLLQMTEKIDDNLNAAQIKAMADAYLSLKNKVQKNLSLNVIGDKRIRSGNVICVNLPELNISELLLCTYAKHTFESTNHSVSVNFRII